MKLIKNIDELNKFVEQEEELRDAIEHIFDMYLGSNTPPHSLMESYTIEDGIVWVKYFTYYGSGRDCDEKNDSFPVEWLFLSESEVKKIIKNKKRNKNGE